MSTIQHKIYVMGELGEKMQRYVPMCHACSVFGGGGEALSMASTRIEQWLQPQKFDIRF
jgi:hypothetical protein